MRTSTFEERPGLLLKLLKGTANLVEEAVVLLVLVVLAATDFGDGVGDAVVLGLGGVEVNFLASGVISLDYKSKFVSNFS